MRKTKIFTVLILLFGLALIVISFKDRVTEINKNGLSYDAVARWELPAQLKEVSAIEWLSDTEIAAVQDEKATIFIYSLKSKKIIQEIDFGKPGDYEGLVIRQKDAYVLRSDGTLYEIKEYKSTAPVINTYETPFTTDNNMESLALNVKKNELLMIPKDHGLESDSSKGIYSFSLETKKMSSEPIYTIEMRDKIFKNFRQSKIYKTFRPSDLEVHPMTGEIYVLEGSKPKLLILDSEGNTKNAYELDKHIFPQPEGIAFSPDGVLYISSEGKKDNNGTITELRLHQ
ncbi:SdiA-regulated domain-containing protein [Zobellia roscoffensis]|uniref:SdiA-regulated domain-containing protein n=1 Tax=Zobellia roscoffensis TaxID=2779508 RepID=UPI00188D9946|nr:SdiA-regulated domain-containing protein [Zobellia roscoffensis]